MRWTVAGAATLGVFLLALWADQQVSLPWLGKAVADRFVVAAAVAAMAGTVMLKALTPWAEHGTAAESAQHPDQPVPTAPASQLPGPVPAGDQITFSHVAGNALGKGVQINNPERDTK